MGAVVDIVSTGFTDLECLLRIQNPNMCTTFEVAVETFDDANQWMQSIIETAQNASARVKLLKTIVIFLLNQKKERKKSRRKFRTKSSFYFYVIAGTST